MTNIRISKGGSGLPSRVIYHGVEGIGKTSFAACAPSPIFGMTRGETGLLTLIDNGIVAETDHFDEYLDWKALLDTVRYLIDGGSANRTYVLDTLNGAERLCLEAVCDDHFDGKWETFNSFGRGVALAEKEWINFLTLLDRLRAKTRMAIVCLCHTKVKAFRNPLGDDYDRFTPDMHDKFWGLAAKWADIVLFGNFESNPVKKDKLSKAKGIGATRRVLYTSRTAAYDAKNRNGLPEQISLGVRATEGWANFLAAMKRSKVVPPKAALPPKSNGGAPEKDESSMPVSGETMRRLGEWMKRLSFTPADREEWCSQHGLLTLAEATPEQGQAMLEELAEAYRNMQENERANSSQVEEGEGVAVSVADGQPSWEDEIG